jgi:Flp pilus assembly protein TadG
MSLTRIVRKRWGLGDRRRSRGQAMVEFALIIPLFLLLLFALLDFGRVIYAQTTIAEDAREGARAALVAALDPTITTADYAKIRTAARLQTAGVAMTDANITGAAGACTLTPSDTVSSSTCFFPNGVVCTTSSNPPPVVVNISVTVGLLTPILSNLFHNSSFTVTASSRTYLPC